MSLGCGGDRARDTLFLLFSGPYFFNTKLEQSKVGWDNLPVAYLWYILLSHVFKCVFKGEFYILYFYFNNLVNCFLNNMDPVFHYPPRSVVLNGKVCLSFSLQTEGILLIIVM